MGKRSPSTVLLLLLLLLPLLLLPLLASAAAPCPFLGAAGGDGAGPCPHALLEEAAERKGAFFWKTDEDAQEEQADESEPPPAGARALDPRDFNTGGAPHVSPAAETTAHGCTCKSKCASTLVHGSFSKCDWCRTQGKCGRWSLLGHWDYCVYKKMDSFEAQSHSDKMAQIWARVTEPSVVGRSAGAAGVMGTLGTLLTESMRPPFDDHMEVLPRARVKVIHAQGVHCRFKLDVAAASPYTGVFAPGSHEGIVRLGSATNLDSLPLLAGMGVKFFRTGVPSGNFVALRTGTPALPGRDDAKHFFSGDLANHLPPPAVFRAMQKFQQASGCISMVGLSGLSRWDQNGAEVATPEFPFLLEFTPLVEVHGKKGGSGGDAAVGASLLATNEHGGERRAGLRRSSMHSKKSNEDLLRELSTIKEGTRLFRVTAYASPKDKTEGNGFELGTMTTTSQCHRSVFGDTRLLFRHQRMEADFARKPEWIEELTKGGHGDGVCTPSARPVSDWQCARHAEEPLSL